MKLFLDGKCEDILKVRSILRSSQLAHATIDTEPTSKINERFKPKFGSSVVLSDELRHSAFIIANVYQPDNLYIQLVDQDLPLYDQMKEDLQKEFGSVINQSPSYCQTPTAGILFRYLLIRKF